MSKLASTSESPSVPLIDDEEDVINASIEAAASTSALKKQQQQPTTSTRRKRGILGAPTGKPMLFSFTSRELWPDDDEEDDDDDAKAGAVDSDEDYQPDFAEARETGGKRSKNSDDDDDYEEEEFEDDLSGNAELIELKASGTNGKSSAKRSPRKKRKPTSPFTAPKRRKPTKTTESSKSAKSSKSGQTKSSPSSRRQNSSNGRSARQSTKSQPTSFTDFNLLSRPLKIDFEQIFPPEILTKIFLKLLEGEPKTGHTLLKLSQVCENWRQVITSTPLLWQRLDLDSIAHHDFSLMSFCALNRKAALFKYVKELNLQGFNGIFAERILQIVVEGIQENGIDLELLSIRHCGDVSAKFLDTITKLCPKLQSLNMSAITSRHQNSSNLFTHAVLSPLLGACGQTLKSLYLSENNMPSFYACIAIVMETCPNLEVLDVSNISSLGARSISISVNQLQRACPKLRILRAANVSFSPTQCPTTEVAPVPGFPHLEELSIPYHENNIFNLMPVSNQEGNTDYTLELLTKGAENLTLLDIRGSRYISPRGLLKIPTWSMRHLSLSNCPKLEDETLAMVFHKWNRTLVDVDLSWNKSDACMDACIGALCEVAGGGDPMAPDAAAVTSQLKSIQLRGSAISYQKLLTLLRACPLLTSIDLQSCRSLPRGIKRAYNVGQDFEQLRTDLLDGKYDNE